MQKQNIKSVFLVIRAVIVYIDVTYLITIVAFIKQHVSK
jgi:hypothetical protein